MREGRKKGWAYLKVFFFLLFMNSLFSLFRAVPEQKYFLFFLPCLETLVLALALWGGSRRPGLVSFAAVIPVTLLVLVGFGETFFRFVYRASFSVWKDTAFAPSFFNMILDTQVFDRTEIVVLSAACVLICAGAAFWLVLTGLSRAARQAGPAFLLPLLVLWIVRFLSAPPDASLSSAVISALRMPEETAQKETQTFSFVPAGEEKAAPPGDVTLFVVESYGHTLFSRKDHYEKIKPVYNRLQEKLSAAGLSVVSHFMQSPAFGGRSWLADGTILSGTWLGSQTEYEGLLKSDAYTMVKFFRGLGYRTIMAAPGMTWVEDGWRSIYPFDELYIRGQFGYKGPGFDFGFLPDQYLLWELFRIRKRNPGSRPVFSVAVMVSSHVPFRIVPPFIPNWHDIGNGEVYSSLKKTRFNNNWLSGGEYPEGFTASIEYVLETALDYAVQFGKQDELFVIIGDHQPRIPISERESTYSVPVHVLSRKPELAEHFLSYGFSRGLEPAQKEEHPRMDSLFSIFQALPIW